MCQRFFVVMVQKVLSCFQLTGIRGKDATRKALTDQFPESQ
jgi:hypothetical protein